MSGREMMDRIESIAAGAPKGSRLEMTAGAEERLRHHLFEMSGDDPYGCKLSYVIGLRVCVVDKVEEPGGFVVVINDRPGAFFPRLAPAGERG